MKKSEGMRQLHNVNYYGFQTIIIMQYCFLRTDYRVEFREQAGERIEAVVAPTGSGSSCTKFDRASGAIVYVMFYVSQ